MHKPVTIGDYSAVVTGLLLGMNLPSTVPWWIPDYRWYVCHSGSQNDIWRTGSEFYESGTGCQMFR